MATAMVAGQMSEEPIFSVHLEPVWRDRANFIVNASLPEPGRFEQLWCKQIDLDRFELCCIPFFLYDAALGDIVETVKSGDRNYVFNRVVVPSGRYVFRVHFPAADPSETSHVVSELTRLGALIEWSSPTLISVDARDETHAEVLAAFLWHGHSQGDFMYETGKS